MALKEKIIERAQKLIQKGAYDKAIAEYRAALEYDPRDASLRLRIGDLYVKSGKTAEAVREYMDVARLNAQKGFYSKAIAVYMQVLKLDETNLEVRAKLADLYAKQRLIANAVAEYSVIVGYFERKKKPAEAVEYLKKMVEVDPENVGVRLKLADHYSKLGYDSDVLSEYSVICEKLLAQGKDDTAEKIWVNAYNRYSDEPAVLRGLAAVYKKRGDTMHFVKFSSALGRRLEAAGDLDGAKAAYDSVLEARPEDEESLRFVSRYVASTAAQKTERRAAPAEEQRKGGVEPAPARRKGEQEPAKAARSVEDGEIEIVLEGFEGGAADAKGAEAAADDEVDIAVEPAYRSASEPDEFIIEAVDEVEFELPGGADDGKAKGGEPPSVAKGIEDEAGADAVSTEFKELSPELRDGIDEAAAAIEELFKDEGREDEVRREEEARLAAEEARREEEARLAAEEARREEETRLAAEAARREQEARLAAEAARREQEARLAAEAARREQEAQLAAEAARREQEAQLAAEAARREQEARLAAEAARREQEARLAAEAARREEEARMAAEEARKAEEARRAEEAMMAETARRLEAARRADELKKKEAARLVEESRRAEEARLAEEAKAAEEKRRVDAERREKAARLAEAVREAEEKRQREAGRGAEAAGPSEPEIDEALIAEASARIEASAAGIEEEGAEEPVFMEQRVEPPGAAEPSEPQALDEDISSAIAELMEKMEERAERQSGRRPEADDGAARPLDTEGFVDLSAELGIEKAVENMTGGVSSDLMRETADEFKTGLEKQFAMEDSETHYNLGVAYMEMEMLAEAVKEFKVALKDQRLAFVCLTRLGLCHSSLKQYGEAVDYYRRAVEIEGVAPLERLGAMYELALCLEAASRRDEAQELFKSIYGADPSYREVALKVEGARAAAPRRRIPLADDIIEIELL